MARERRAKQPRALAVRTGEAPPQTGDRRSGSAAPVDWIGSARAPAGRDVLTAAGEPAWGRPSRRLGKNPLDLAVRPRDHVDRDQLTNAAGRGGTRVGRRPCGADIP